MKLVWLPPPLQPMAYFSRSFHDVIICVIILCCVQPSLQDCPPRFNDYPSIAEGPDTKGRVLLTTTGVTELRLVNNDNGYLAVNRTQLNGATDFILYIAKEVDYEVKTQIDGEIRCASSGGQPADYNVLVTFTDKNEFAPEFVGVLPYTANVPEDTSSGTTVFTVSATDRDGSSDRTKTPMLYAVENNKSPFIMSGQFVILNGSLDYETGPTLYNLNITAAERQTGGLTNYTTLTIHITDVDDNGPLFGYNATYQLSVPEGTYTSGDGPFSTTPPLTARDGDQINATIAIQLDPTSSSLANKVRVQSDGSIKLIGRLDPGQYPINVRAYQVDRQRDRFAIASVVVTVYDINDHSPSMSSPTYSGSVLEGAVPGTVVLTVSASDMDKGDNSSFQFFLQENGVPFNVTTDRTVGMIKVSGPIDRETTPSYTLHVFAEEDKTSENHQSNASVVTITVLDANDNAPEFQKDDYTFSVNETATALQVVGQVNATDRDEGANSNVTYSITRVLLGVAGAFQVNQSSGVITLSRDLRQNDTGSVLLELKAEDNPADGQSKRSASTLVTVKILAVNQDRPVFTRTNYSFPVDETAPINFSVGNISATDSDGDPLQYTLEGAGGAFRLEGNPPRLLVNTSLDLDKPPNAQTTYSFQVAVTDGQNRVTASVNVTVNPVNEYSPVMGLSVYPAFVWENATAGSLVKQISATDADSGADGQVNFTLISQDNTPFVLGSSGSLTLNCNRCLDFNQRKNYTLVVKATDGGNPAKSNFSTVFISVIDVNNKAPRFSSSVITGSVSESAVNGTTILQLQATDEDTPASQLTYSLDNATPADWLTLSNRAVVTSRPLDAETYRFITATVKVSDGVQEGTASLNITVLDVNDNFPQIVPDSPTVQVMENASVGSHVLDVSASDRDVTQTGDFLFYLGSPTSGKFAINSSTGEVTVAAPFDRRLQKDYDLTVSVSDNQAPPKMNSTVVHVTITDSNTAPEFVDSSNRSVLGYAFNVSETADVDFVVGQVQALDPDSGSSGHVRYHIQSGNEQNKFVLDADTGRLSLLKKLDYEEKSTYSLTVNASDNSYEPKSDTATVTIQVEDVIEAPQWPDPLPLVSLTTGQQCRNVQLDARPQDVLQAASSSHSDVVYSLLNNTLNFSINNATGLLRVNGSLEARDYNIGLRACSALNTSVCSDAVLTVRVSATDVIGFCPPFLTVNVNESVGNGSFVVDLNSTKGDTNILYSLLEEDTLPFRVNRTTGVVTVEGKLDRETKDLYILRVVGVLQSSNGSATAQVTVVLTDAPDSPPKFDFSKYEGAINESESVGASVLKMDTRTPLTVNADDPDVNPKLVYSIVETADNSNGSFAVDPTTGVITLARSVDLENMTAALLGRYTFDVMVSDGYFNDSTTVTVVIINHNDNDPVFQPNILRFTVNEGEPLRYQIAILHATDRDTGDTENLQYSLVPSGDQVPFNVSPSGALLVSSKLDRETKDSYTFTVVASDKGGRNGTAIVIISVGDANEVPSFNRSTYVLNVTEGLDGVGQELTLTASDGDLGENSTLTFAIEAGDTDGAFNITTTSDTTAILQVASMLDREKSPTLDLTVVAIDGGQPSLTATCTVQVNVADVNDNSPVFTSASYKAEVSEGASNNTQLSIFPSLRATDEDTGLFGEQGVVYSLENQASPSVPFWMNATTGDLFVYLYNDTDQLDREVTPTYTLTVVAKDNQGTGLNGTATVVVSLTNVNDHKPVFLQPYYDIDLTENADIGSLVTTFNATDRDGDLSVLRFELYRGEASDKFYLNPVTGELRVAGLLDRERQEKFQLSLGVSDGLFTGTADATITLEDVNDESPVFHNARPLTLKVTENRDPYIIHVFNVTDADVGQNGNVTLFINDTAVSPYIGLSADGVLQTLQRLDREQDGQKSLTFIVWAKDAGTPPLVTSLEVKVEVQGVNEWTPQVCQIMPHECGTNISLTATTGSAEGTFLAALTWDDNDEGKDGQATLSLTQDPDNLFSLNQTTSSSSSSNLILTLAKTLDRDDLYLKGWLGEDNVTYTAEVMAMDQGQPSRNSSVRLTLTVLELLPSTPVFSSSVYNFSVPENQIVSVIGRVKATAKSTGAAMNYSLESTTDFTVDKAGNVSTLLELDREENDFYSFLVLAWDSPRPVDTASAVVLVRVLDENDNSPKLSSSVYDVTVPEGTSDVKLMTVVATDVDAGENGLITFTLLNNTLDDVFVLNSSSGELYLNQSLDRETESFYTLLVQAADGGTPSKNATATVRITVQDKNDNSPQFSQQSYRGFLDENSPAATLVQNVSATDPDAGTNGQVLYQLDPSQVGSSAFYINEFTGAIFTSRGLNYDTEQYFDLIVLARDLGDPAMTSSVHVMIYINDLSRVLPQLTFDPEVVGMVLGTPAGSLVPVNVSGGYGNFNFSIIGGNEEGLFEMDSETGELSVTRELTQTQDYLLTIRVINVNATDYFTDGTLRVSVTSVKLEQERYAAVLKENTPPPYLLLDINSNAERSGIPVVYTLQEDNPTDAFYVVKNTGQLYCNRTLDREVRAEYIMQVMVQLAHQSTSGRRKRALSSAAEIVVIVDDVNDNPPDFQLTSKIFGIPSAAPAFTVVTTLKADDPDSGDNGVVKYEATGGDVNVFYVTSEGKVTSQTAMPSKANQEFTLTVNATDQNGAGKSTRITIKIVVVPNSDRFGLVANISVTDFVEKQQFYLRNLSDILNMTLQLDRVEPHQGTAIDTSKSDIFFYAFDNDGKSIPFAQISEKTTEKADEINALFGAYRVELIPVTDTPVKVRIQTRYAMGEAEIAVIIVACLIFVGSFVAIILTLRAWRKQKQFALREESAVRARHILEQETRDLADKIQETSFVADPDEPLELAQRSSAEVVTEDQECVINFGNETTGLDTLVLRRMVLRQTEAALMQTLLEEGGEGGEAQGADRAPLDVHEADSGTDQHSGAENHEGSLSSGEHRYPDSEAKGEGSAATASGAAADGEGRGSRVSAGESSTDLPLESAINKILSSKAPLPVTVKTLPTSYPPPPPPPPEGRNESARDSAPVPPLKNEAAGRLVKLRGASMDESMTEDNENTPETSWQARHPVGTPPLRRRGPPANATSPGNALEADEGGDARPEDPEPDYQKKVSFAGVADAKEDPDVALDIVDGKKRASDHHPDTSRSSASGQDFADATTKLLPKVKARTAEAFENPAFQKEEEIDTKKEEEEKVLDGWAKDYGQGGPAYEVMSTAL